MYLGRRYVVATVILLILLITVVATPHADAVSWSANLTRVTTYGNFDGFPTMLEAHDGRLWMAWARDIFGNLTLVYTTSHDLGTTWTQYSNLTTEPGPGQNTSPVLIQAQNGSIWLFWAASANMPTPPPPLEPDFVMNAYPKNLTIPKGDSANSTITVTSLNDFSAPVNLTVGFLPDNVTAILNPTQVVPPSNGRANSTLTVSVGTEAVLGNYTLTVMGKNCERKRTTKVYLEITEVGVASLANREASASSSASTSDDDYELFYKVSHDNGATWSTGTPLTDNDYDDLKPSVTQLSNGTIFVFWQSHETGNADIFYTTTLTGVSWSTPQQLTIHSREDKGPSVMQAKDGRIWVVWTSERTGDYEIYYNIWDGSSWSGDTRWTYNTTTNDVGPTILQTIDQKIWIFWSSSSITASNNIYYKHSSDNGATWSASIQFTTDANEDVWPCVKQTRDTKIWVMWVSNRADQPDGNWDIYMRTSIAGDINEDGEVNIIDLSIVGLAYGTFIGEPEYNPQADLTCDGLVDIRDISIVSLHYGAT